MLVDTYESLVNPGHFVSVRSGAEPAHLPLPSDPTYRQLALVLEAYEVDASCGAETLDGSIRMQILERGYALHGTVDGLAAGRDLCAFPQLASAPRRAEAPFGDRRAPC
jgi:hypothetical protein